MNDVFIDLSNMKPIPDIKNKKNGLLLFFLVFILIAAAAGAILFFMFQKKNSLGKKRTYFKCNKDKYLFRGHN